MTIDTNAMYRRVTAVRDGAAEALVERGWTRGMYERQPLNLFSGPSFDGPDHPMTSGICASSAFQVAVGLPAQPVSHERAVSLVGWDNVFTMHVTKRAFVLHLARTRQWYHSIYATPPVHRASWKFNAALAGMHPAGTEYLDSRIVDYNDSPDRSAYEVLTDIMEMGDGDIRAAMSVEMVGGQMPGLPLTDPAEQWVPVDPWGSTMWTKPADSVVDFKGLLLTTPHALAFA